MSTWKGHRWTLYSEPREKSRSALAGRLRVVAEGSNMTFTSKSAHLWEKRVSPKGTQLSWEGYREKRMRAKLFPKEDCFPRLAKKILPFIQKKGGTPVRGDLKDRSYISIEKVSILKIKRRGHGRTRGKSFLGENCQASEVVEGTGGYGRAWEGKGTESG